MDAFPGETMADRLRLTLDMSEFGERMFRQRIRRERPDADDRDIDEAVMEWLARRPGAELGDIAGSIVVRQP